MGYERDNFTKADGMEALPGSLAIGHVRYSTAGSKGATASRDVQPGSYTHLDVYKRQAYDTGATREEHKADADFHEAIAEASHNSMFLYLHAGILRLLREHISLNLQALEDPSGKVTNQLRQQHLDIWHAIRRRQPDAARQAMLAHIDFTRSELASRDI